MNPLEQIKLGIKNNDMELIEAGYRSMATEENVHIVNEESEILEDSPTKSHVEEEVVEDDPFKVQIRGKHKPQTRTLEDGTEETEARKETVDLSKIGAFNMFEDTGEEDIDNRERDKALYVKKPEIRRKEVKKVVATCNHCQKTFKVLPIHQLEGSFTCEKCIRGKIRR